jgi:NADPH-dependent ferric siderophore reductase
MKDAPTLSAPQRTTATTTDAAPAIRGPRGRAPPRRVMVGCVRHLSPAMRRVTFIGPELAGFSLRHPASYIKLIFPEAGQSEPARPTADGPRPTLIRTYTPLAARIDAAGACEVDVDFVLHGEGPAATWAAQATPGQVLYMGGPGPGYELDVDAAHHLLIADDSALPAVETILAALPASARVTVLIEVISAAEQRSIVFADTPANPAMVDAQWLARGADHRLAGVALEAALRDRSAIPTDCKIYIACEAAAMRRIRQYLWDERGVARSQIVGRGYWKLDAINHPDHDYGDDR